MNQVSLLRDVIKTTSLIHLTQNNRRKILENIDPSFVDVKQEISKVTDFVLASKKGLKSLENNLGIDVSVILLISQYFSNLEEMQNFLSEHSFLFSIPDRNYLKKLLELIHKKEDLITLKNIKFYRAYSFSSNGYLIFCSLVEFIKRIGGSIEQLNSLYEILHYKVLYGKIEKESLDLLLHFCNGLEDATFVLKNNYIHDFFQREEAGLIISKISKLYTEKGEIIKLLRVSVISYFLSRISIQDFEIFIKFYHSKEDFENFLQNNKFRESFLNIKTAHLKIVSSLIHSKEDFKKILSIKRIENVLTNPWMYRSNLAKIFEIFKFSSIRSFSEWLKIKKNEDIITFISEINFDKIISLYPTKKDINKIPEHIVTFLTKVSANIFYQVWNLYGFQDKQDFEIFCQNENILELLLSINSLNLKLLFDTEQFKTRQDFEVVIQNNSISEIFINLDTDPLKLFLNFYKIQGSEKLESFCEKLLKFGVKNISDSNTKLLEVLMKFSKNITKFEQFFQSPCVLEVLKKENISSQFLLSILKKCHTLENFELISKNRYFFGIDSREKTITSLGSQFLTELMDLQLQFRFSEIEILKQKIESFLQFKGPPANILKESKKRDVSIYVRYGHQVDYPEIAEAYILFVQAYKRLGFSQVFHNIRIIPRYKNIGPSQELFEDTSTKFYADVSREKFEKALHRNSIAIFLSHSTNSGTVKTPSIISDGMVPHKNDIVSKLELEKSCQGNAFSQKSSMIEIFEEIFANLQAIEAYYINKK